MVAPIGNYYTDMQKVVSDALATSNAANSDNTILNVEVRLVFNRQDTQNNTDKFGKSATLEHRRRFYQNEYDLSAFSKLVNGWIDISPADFNTELALLAKNQFAGEMPQPSKLRPNDDLIGLPWLRCTVEVYDLTENRTVDVDRLFYFWADEQAAEEYFKTNRVGRFKR